MMLARLSRRSLLAGAGALALAPAASAGERRIVSIGSAVTEILYRLGVERDIVGVDQTSQHPPEALSEKKNVGYVRQLGAEGILSLRPTLVIASAEARPTAVLDIVAQAGITVVRVPEEHSAEGVAKRIALIADAVGEVARGGALAREISDGFAALALAREKIRDRKRVMFVLSFQNGRPLVAGQDTSAAAIIALAGGENATPGLQGWKPLSDEGVIAAAPDLVLTMNRGPGEAAGADIFATPAFSATPAARTKAILVMDAVYLLGFGPRTPKAARELFARLYPDLAAGRAP